MEPKKENSLLPTSQTQTLPKLSKEQEQQVDALVSQMDISHLPLKSIMQSSFEAVSEGLKSGNFDLKKIIQVAFKKTIVKEVQAGNMQLPPVTKTDNQLTDGRKEN